MSTAIALVRPRRGWIDTSALRDVAPILVGLVPFAMILGVTMKAGEIDIPAGVAGSFLLYAGSAQLAALSLMDGGGGLALILLTVVIVNARMLLYGGALEPHFRDQPRWFRWLGPHFLVDQSYVLASERKDLSDPARFRFYWLTVAAAITVTWLTTVGVTMAAGRALPTGLPLAFAPIAVFVTLLMPKVLTDPSARRVALVAGAATATAGAVAPRAALIVGVAAGVGSELLKGGGDR